MKFGLQGVPSVVGNCKGSWSWALRLQEGRAAAVRVRSHRPQKKGQCAPKEKELSQPLLLSAQLCQNSGQGSEQRLQAHRAHPSYPCLFLPGCLALLPHIPRLQTDSSHPGASASYSPVSHSTASYCLLYWLLLYCQERCRILDFPLFNALSRHPIYKLLIKPKSISPTYKRKMLSDYTPSPFLSDTNALLKVSHPHLKNRSSLGEMGMIKNFNSKSQYTLRYKGMYDITDNSDII